jgi:hypothetical protein
VQPSWDESSEKLPCATTGDIRGFGGITSTYYIGMIPGPPNQQAA